MNIRELIESGTLELYVANLLPADEAAEVEVAARAYPEVRAAIEEIEQTIEAFAEAQAIRPPADIKGRIMDEISDSTAAQDPKPEIQNSKSPPPQ